MATQQSPQILIGRLIAKRRSERGLTQDQLAERLEIGSEAVSRIERGIIDIKLTKLLMLADVFECSLAELLTESSPRSDDQAERISTLIADLPEGDRTVIIEMVERLAGHFAGKPSS